MIRNDCTRWISTLLNILIVFLFVAACTPTRVPIPNPEADQAPVISVGAVASGGGADIQYASASPSTCASPCKNAVTLSDKNGTADIVLTVSAENLKGGVKDLSVVVTQGGPLYTVSTSGTPDAQNLVPVSLSILGKNNTGGIGSDPLLIQLNKTKTNATAFVEADNFSGGGSNNGNSIYAVTYYVKGLIEAKLSASKNDIYNDEQTKLIWKTTNADSIAITPVVSPPPLPQEVKDGSRLVGPFLPGHYTYTLTARNWLETATSSTTINVTERPHIGATLSLMLNFTCPGGQVTPSTTFAGLCEDSEGNCNSPSPNSRGSFTTPPYNQPVTCSAGTGGFSTFSLPDLQSGDSWKVTVTPNIPSLNLVGVTSEACSVQVKAGEFPYVIFDYEKTQDGWSSSCRPGSR